MPTKSKNSIKAMSDGDISVAKKVARRFDSEGSGYDYDTAIKYGIRPDETGHWPSREPKTGRILKGKKHKTFYKTIKGEKEAGYEIYKGPDGMYYSRKVKN